MNDSPIGLIGVGLLGTALAERMLAAGMAVVGHDCDASRGQRLREIGGRFVASAVEVVNACGQIVVCLPDSRVVADVVAQLREHLVAGKLLIDATTGDPDETAALAEGLVARGVGYTDATIAGSSEQARRGEALIVVGGSPKDVDRANLVLKSWSERRFHVGPAGSGARMKLIVNLVLGLNRAALAEALALANACGIDQARALEVLKASPAYSTIMATKGTKMISGEYAPQARLAQHFKDVQLIQELARRHAARVPLSEVHATLLQTAIELGFGDADNSAIIEAFKRGGERSAGSGQEPE